MNEATRIFIREHLNADVPTLALKKAPIGIDISLALRQIEARQLLQKKVPAWSQNDDLLFPVRLSIEQCSSETTAQYKAALLHGDTFADLTGGLGIDTYYITKLHSFIHADYVERQPELCALAKHNFSTLGLNIQVWNESSEDYLRHCNTIDCIYLDPARRDANGRKTISIGDCTPNVAEMQELLLEKAKLVMVKLSPMLDISKALSELRCVSDIHVVAVGNECKELLFLMQRDFKGQPTLHCVNLLTVQPTLSFTIEQERDCPLRLADAPQRYLYEPNATLMKAGGYKWLSAYYGLLKLHKNSHLYTSESLISNFAGRIFEVESWSEYNKKLKTNLLSDLDKANLAVRNFPLSVEELRKTLKITDGGDVYLFATTLHDGRKVIIKTRKSDSN